LKAKFTLSVTISEEREPDIFEWVRNQPGSMQSIIRDLLRREAHAQRAPVEPARQPAAAAPQPTTPHTQGQRVPVASFGGPSPDKSAESGFVNTMLDRG
jgi:hypothetical protein